jgi:hypothetical protein
MAPLTFGIDTFIACMTKANMIAFAITLGAAYLLRIITKVTCGGSPSLVGCLDWICII